jgi:hypothetical protein
MWISFPNRLIWHYLYVFALLYYICFDPLSRGGLTRRTSQTMQVQGFEMKGVSLVDIGVIFLNVISYSLNEWYLYIDN